MNNKRKKALRFLTPLLSVPLILVSQISQQSRATEYIYETPKILNFTVSQDSIEIAQSNPELIFNLKVSHPIGISSEKTVLWFTSRNKNFQLSTDLIRQPLEVEKVVTFTGTLKFNADLTPGIYDFYADPIEGMSHKSGLANPKTDPIYPIAFNKFLNAEKSVLVRLGGNLNLANKTFVGPTYSSLLSITDDVPIIYSEETPIFRVGESYDPLKYFNKRVQNLILKISTTTPSICMKDGEKLKFISVGNCNFKVFTEKNSDYLETSISLSAEIAAPRVKPTITLPPIATQTSIGLPKKIDLNLVYNTAGDVVIPKTLSPTVCVPSGLSIVTIVSGGTCIITYQSPITNTYLESDLYQLTFEITRSSQTISFTPPAIANISAKTLALSATASGGGVITYRTTSTGICSITGSTLNLLKGGNCAITATQAGTTTLAPISATATVMIAGSVAPTKKTTTCVKGNKTEKVSGTNPKCPKGYKVKR
jgi:hypothetical protein